MSLPAPCPGANRVAYQETTSSQKSHALASIQQELDSRFPNLSWLNRAQVFDELQPDLLVQPEGATLAPGELERVTQHLAGQPVLPRDKKAGFDGRILYLARRLADHAEIAVLALAELEAQPPAYGPYTYALLTKLAAGNGVVEEVLQELTGSSVLSGRPGQSLPAELIPGSPIVTTRLRVLARTYR